MSVTQLPLECQLTVNGNWSVPQKPLECQLTVNGLPPNCHLSATWVPLDCQSSVIQLPIESQWSVKYMSNVSGMSIECQWSIFGTSVKYIWQIPLECQLNANVMTHDLLKYWTKWDEIHIEKSRSVQHRHWSVTRTKYLSLESCQWTDNWSMDCHSTNFYVNSAAQVLLQPFSSV